MSDEIRLYLTINRLLIAPDWRPIYDLVMTTLSIQCPDALAQRLQQLVRDGWVTNEQEAIIEALRRFLESHRPELIESQIHSDIEWGLHGRD